MPAPPSALVTIDSGELLAGIDPLGAQLSILQDRAGRDLLWNGDRAVWAGRAPLLFPIVGMLAGGRYRLGNHRYPLPRHGFARGSRFTLTQQSATRAIFELRADEATRSVYPFSFLLTITFEVRGSGLSLTTVIRNDGGEPMPASFGYHPALRWPLPYGSPRAEHFIEFAVEEPDPVRRIDTAGLLTAARHPTPVQHRRLLLDDALFEDDVLIFDRVRSRSLTYGAGERRLRVEFPDAPYLGLWSKPGAHFICIEPWHGVTDAVDFSGDFRDKEGIFLVPPGTALSTTMTIAEA